MSIKHGTNRFFDRVDPSTGGGDSFWERDATVVNLVDDSNEVAIGGEVVSAAGERLRVVGGIRSDTSGYLELATGAAVAVAPAGSGRFRYNQALNRLEFSENAGAYQPFGALTSPWTVTAGVIHPLVLANQVAVGVSALPGVWKFLVKASLDTNLSSLVRVEPERTVPYGAGQGSAAMAVRSVNLAGDDASSQTVGIYVDAPTVGNVGAVRTGIAFDGDDATSNYYNDVIRCYNQDLTIGTTRYAGSGNGPSVQIFIGDANTAGDGGSFVVVCGDAASTAGSKVGGSMQFTAGAAAIIGPGSVAGADVTFTTGDAVGDGISSSTGGNFLINAGQGTGPNPTNNGTGRFIIRDAPASLELHWFTGVDTNYIVGFSVGAGSTLFGSERIAGDMKGPTVRLQGANGDATTPGAAFEGGGVTIAAGRADANGVGAFSAAGGSVDIGGGAAATGGPAAVGGSISLRTGAGVGGGNGGLITFQASLTNTGGYLFCNTAAGVQCLTVGAEGWAYVGNATDPATQGDFAAGIGGQGRMFFDQSATTLALHLAAGTNTVTLDATTSAGYVGIGATAAAGPFGTESLRAMGLGRFEVGSLAANASGLLVAGGTDTDGSTLINAVSSRTADLPGGAFVASVRANLVTRAGDGVGAVMAAYLADPVTRGGATPTAAIAIRGVYPTNHYDVTLIALDQPLIVTAASLIAGNGQPTILRGGDGLDDGVGGSISIDGGAADAISIAGTYAGGVVSIQSGAPALFGAGAMGGANVFVTTSSAVTDGMASAAGGDVVFTLGAGAGGGAYGKIECGVTGGGDAPDFVPAVDDRGSVGTAATRWRLVRAVTITSGDVCFDDAACPLCGAPFHAGEPLVMYVVSVEHDAAGRRVSRTVPAHARCVGFEKAS